ncbi:MAG TPA: hypothetical protein VIU37_03940, partial [Candidatus Limnocylindrales bacterium]
SKGSETAQSLRLVWVETSLAVGTALLSIGVFMKAGFSTLTLTVDTLLLWSVLIYGSATDYALGDPDRPPESLRRKAALELTDGPIGKVVRPSFLIVGAAAVLVAALVVEAGRAPVQPSEGGVPQALGGLPEIALGPSPGPSLEPGATQPPGSSPTPAPAASAMPTATPSSSATPTPVPSSPPPVPSASPVPSATPAPTTSPAASSTPAPTPSPS